MRCLNNEVLELMKNCFIISSLKHFKQATELLFFGNGFNNKTYYLPSLQHQLTRNKAYNRGF